MYGFEQITRRAHPHQIPRLIFRQQRCHRRGAVLALLAGFAHRQTADGKPIEGQLGNDSSALDSQILIARTLDDAEHRLRRIAAGRQATLCPTMCKLHGASGGRMIHGRWYALIQHHHDVGADELLGLDAAFRTQSNDGLVQIAFEFRMFLGQGAAAGKRKDLESAGIGQHRSRPVHEAVNAAEFLEDRRSWTQQQVIRVGQQHLRPAFEQVLAALRAHHGVGAHRHESRRQHLIVQGGKAGSSSARAGGSGF
jgi:hypothetical protein